MADQALVELRMPTQKLAADAARVDSILRSTKSRLDAITNDRNEATAFQPLLRAFSDLERGYTRLDRVLRSSTSTSGTVTRSFGQLDRAILSTASTARSSGGTISSAFSAIGKAAGGLGTIIGGVFGGTLLTRGFDAITGGFSSVISKGLEFNSVLDRAQFAFSTFLGNRDAANSFISELRGFSRSIGQEFANIQPLATRLFGVGFQRNEIIPFLRDVGDAVAAVGGGAPELERAITALTQIRGKGRVQAEEVRGQLGELGLPIIDIISQKTGLRPAEINRLADAGKLRADAFIKVLLEGFRERFGGARQRFAAETTAGLEDALSAAFGETAGSATKSLAFAKKSALTVAVGQLQSQDAQALAESVDKFAQPILSGLFGTVDKALKGQFAEAGKDAITLLIEGMGQAVNAGLGVFQRNAIDPLINSILKAFQDLPQRIGDLIKQSLPQPLNDAIGSIEQFLGHSGSGVPELRRLQQPQFQTAPDGSQLLTAPGAGLTQGAGTAARINPAIEQRWAEIGKYIFGGLEEGAEGEQRKSPGLWDRFIDYAKKKLGIQSPSTVFAEIGRDTWRGFEIGFREEAQAGVTRLAGVFDGLAARQSREARKIINDPTRNRQRVMRPAEGNGEEPPLPISDIDPSRLLRALAGLGGTPRIAGIASSSLDLPAPPSPAALPTDLIPNKEEIIASALAIGKVDEATKKVATSQAEYARTLIGTDETIAEALKQQSRLDVADSLTQLISGRAGFRDAAAAILDSLSFSIAEQISSRLTERLFQELFDPFFDALGKTLQKGLDSVFSGLFGGASGGGLGSLFKGIGKFFGNLFGGSFAGGGSVFPNTINLVGERGPEFFVPRSPGFIVNQQQAAAAIGGGSVNVSVNFNGVTDFNSFRRNSNEINRQMAAAVEQGNRMRGAR